MSWRKRWQCFWSGNHFDPAVYWDFQRHAWCCKHCGKKLFT